MLLHFVAGAEIVPDFYNKLLTSILFYKLRSFTTPPEVATPTFGSLKKWYKSSF